MYCTEETKELFTALSAFQSEMKSIKKDADNPFFKSSYATLDACWDSVREPLSNHGLSIAQLLDWDGGVDVLVTILAHNSGQIISSKARLVPVKHDPQAMGSCITYFRRFALCAILGLTQSDDDAEATVGRSGENHLKRPIDLQSIAAPSVSVGPVGYKIPFGKWKGLGLEDVEASDLRSYIVFIEDTASKEGKPLKGQTLEFVTKATTYLGAAENISFQDIQF